MKISLISGILIQRDAISASILTMAQALRELFESADIEVDLRIYVFISDYDHDGTVKIVKNAADVVLDDHFMSSDLIVYDFGFHTEMFDSIHLAPSNSKIIVRYHNITPPELMPESQRAITMKSFEQQTNLLKADLILTVSKFNIETLIEYGIDEKDIAYINLVLDFPQSNEVPITGKRSNQQAIEAIYVGRFVPSKGVIDILKALHLATDQGVDNVNLNLIGNLQLSNDAYVDQIYSLIDEYKLTDRVNLLPSISDEKLSECYRNSQLFITASYHEGFCMPVIEALHHECFVISYDAANLPYVVNGLGNIVETGNIEALAEAIVNYADSKKNSDNPEQVILNTDSGPMSEAEFKRKAYDYSLEYTYESFRDHLLDILKALQLIS